MNFRRTRREFLRDMGLSTAVLPFVWNLPSLGFASQQKRKQRLVIMFSPNGVIPSKFWPEEEGALTSFAERSLEALEPFKKHTLLLHGISNKVQSGGESHQNSIGCLLTGVPLLPGSMQFRDANNVGGEVGWAGGISIDQEIKNHLQRKRSTRTRFGSLEFGVMVPDIANTWTRMVYAGPNKPIAPIVDPYQMFDKLYGRMKGRETIKSLLDDLQEQLHNVKAKVGVEDRHLLEEHATFVREMEQELKAANDEAARSSIPKLKAGVEVVKTKQIGAKPETFNKTPRISKMQIDLLVASLAADFTRVATLQYTQGISDMIMSWKGIEKTHHEVAHHGPEEIMVEYDKWFCEQLAYLVRRLSKTPEPGGGGSLLDHTVVLWANGHGDGWHSQGNIPYVLVGGGMNFRMGRMAECNGAPHNRVWLSLAHGMGHDIKEFGNPELCEEGPLSDLS